MKELHSNMKERHTNDLENELKNLPNKDLEVIEESVLACISGGICNYGICDNLNDPYA